MRLTGCRASIATLCVALTSPASAVVSIDWTVVTDPGNACEAQTQGCFGAVGGVYEIDTFEITNAEYAEFLNAKAASDPLGLYDVNMANVGLHGGITRSGSPGSFTYSAIAGREDMPVNLVSFYDALRFANWLDNGQGSGATETGAYTLLGGTATPSNGATVTRNAGAAVFLASEDEWYKAAYYDALSAGFFDYPAGSNTAPVCAVPTATANRANCGNAVSDLTTTGSYPGSPSPYGTFDQGGNAMEWTEGMLIGSPGVRAVRGGAWNGSGSPAAATQLGIGGGNGSNNIGFRVAPEPAREGLLGAGIALLGALSLLRHRSRGQEPRQPRGRFL